MGMNMVSKGVEKALSVIQDYFPDMDALRYNQYISILLKINKVFLEIIVQIKNHHLLIGQKVVENQLL